MDVTVCIGTFGDVAWMIQAGRAIRSAEALAPVSHRHGTTLAQARNEAAAIAGTEWLCFLDADDELTPGYFEAMGQGTADLRGPAVQYVRPNGRAEAPKLWPAVDLRDGNYLIIGTLVRRAMFDAVGGFREFPIYEDWDLWQRCARAGASVEQIPEAIYRAHVRPDSRNRAPDRREREHWHHEIRRANFPECYEEATA